MNTNLRRPSHERFPQHGRQLGVLKEIQDACAKGVKVHALIPQGHGAWVGFQRLDDFLRKGGRRGHGDVRLGVFMRTGGGDGKHLGEPEGERNSRAGLEWLSRVVIEVAEVGDVDFELAGDFLGQMLVVLCIGPLGRERTSASVRMASTS